MAQIITATWLGGTGNWNDPTQWDTDPIFPNDDGQLYSAAVPAGTVILNQDITIEQFTFGSTTTGTTLLGGNTLNINSTLSMAQGLIFGGGALNANGPIDILGTIDLYGWRLSFAGDTTWSGQLYLGNATVENAWGASINLSDGAVCSYYANGYPNALYRTLNNYGTINANAETIGATLDISLNNFGTINVNSGTLVMADGGSNPGRINLINGATLDFETTNVPSSTSLAFPSTGSISGIGSVKFNSGASFSITGNYDISDSTTVGFASNVVFASPLVNIGSSVEVNGQYAVLDLGSNSIAVSTLNLRLGIIKGTGDINVSGVFEWNEGSMLGTGTTNANGGVFFNGLTDLDGPDLLDRTLNCYGSSQVQTTNAYQGVLYSGLNAALNIMPGASFNGSRLLILGSDIGGETWGTVTNLGTLVIDDPGLNRGMAVSGTNVENRGVLKIINSTLNVRGTTPGQAPFIQDGGSIHLDGGNFNTDTISQLNSGSLIGHGYFGSLVSNGVIAPLRGSLISYSGTLTLQTNSILSYVLTGRRPGVSYGQITQLSTATLAGGLRVALAAGFWNHISRSDSFTLLSAQTVTGQFSNASNGGRVSTADGRGSFLVTYDGGTVVLTDFQLNPFARSESAFFNPL